MANRYIKTIIDFFIRNSERIGFTRYEWDTMDYKNPDKAEQYLKDNMKEGFLATEEESFIEELTDEYKRLRTLENDIASFLEDKDYLKVM